MKRVGSYYQVVSLNDQHGLGWNKESFDGAVAMIEQQAQNARAKGYNDDEKWLIVAVEWEKTFDEQLWSGCVYKNQPMTERGA